MKRIISKKALKDFWKKNPDSKVYLETWYETVKLATWEKPTDIKAFYTAVSILKNSRVVFNISGNKYRLIVKINYQKQWIFFRFVGTHIEYDQIDANNI